MSANEAMRLFNDVLSRTIAEVRERGTNVFTFAFYHDHESAAVSVCVDTEPNSAREVLSENAFGMKYFADAIADGDLKQAALWKANIGRSLSLGDFELVNVALTDLGSVTVDDDFYLSMIRALRSRENDIVQLARQPHRLLFCSSSADAEVGYLWTAEPTIP